MQAAARDLTPHEWNLIRELVVFTQPPLRVDLLKVTQQRHGTTPEQFDHAWVRLQQEKHILYVSRNNDTIRFSDPLLAPFLRAYLLRPRAIEGEQSTVFEETSS